MTKRPSSKSPSHRSRKVAKKSLRTAASRRVRVKTRSKGKDGIYIPPELSDMMLDFFLDSIAKDVLKFRENGGGSKAEWKDLCLRLGNALLVKRSTEYDRKLTDKLANSLGYVMNSLVPSSELGAHTPIREMIRIFCATTFWDEYEQSRVSTAPPPMRRQKATSRYF